jgi:hypothetical protein
LHHKNIKKRRKRKKKRAKKSIHTFQLHTQRNNKTASKRYCVCNGKTKKEIHTTLAHVGTQNVSSGAKEEEKRRIESIERGKRGEKLGKNTFFVHASVARETFP